MNDWRHHLQGLHAAIIAARLAEERARDAYRLAQAGRKEAERRLAAWIKAEAEPCPLFDGVTVQAEPGPPAVQAQPGQSTPVAPAPRLAAVELVPGNQVQARKLADVEVQGHRAALWMEEDGSIVLLFALFQFGNWDRNDLPQEAYTPSVKEIEQAARAASGLDLEEMDRGPHGAGTVDCHLWEILFHCPESQHPEPWRQSNLDWLPGKWASPLKRADIDSLGKLAVRLEDPGFPASLRGLAKGATREELLALVAGWWGQHTSAGRRGEFPSWLPVPVTPGKPAQDWCSWAGGLDGLREAAKGWTVEQLVEAARRFDPTMPSELGVIREEQARRNPSVPEATVAPTKKPARKRKPKTKQTGEPQPDQADQDQGDRPEVQTWDVYHTQGRDVPLGQVEARTWERAHALAARTWEGKTVLVVGAGEPCPQERPAGWVHPDWCRPVEFEISHFPHHNLRTVWDPDARQPLVVYLPDGRAIPLDPTGWQHLPLGHAATQLLGEALREETPR